MARCKKCQTKFIPKYFNCKYCLGSDECISAFNEFVKETQQKQNAKKWRAEKKELKEKVKTLSDYEKEAKKSFQKWIRLRDQNLPCISCGNADTDDWAGGHYFPAGIYSGLMFDENNCHKQCNTYCNKWLSGNLIEYRKGLIKRYGIEFVEQLESMSDAKRDYKYTKNELIAKKLQYDIKIKEIKITQNKK